MQGLGGALLEQFIYDEDGQLLTGSLADYLLPTASDFPNIRAVALEQKPSPHNPLGAKGAGEGGIIPVGGVIANAVAAALPLPFGVERRANGYRSRRAACGRCLSEARSVAFPVRQTGDVDRKARPTISCSSKRTCTS